METKILLYDLETFPNISYHWQGKYEQSIIEIIEEGYIICMGYKWKGENKSHIIGLPDCGWNKQRLAKKIHEIISKADITIAHNGDYFDEKWINRSCIVNGLKPIPPHKTIDTLKIAKSKFNFNSNSLKDLAILLGLIPKKETGGFQLWKGYVAKDKKSIKKMHEYCKNDVDLLELVYEKLSPWAKTPSFNHGMECTNCGSTHLQSRGWNITQLFKTRRFQCQDCGRWMSSNNKIKIGESQYTK
jgi:hypothetical protein